MDKSRKIYVCPEDEQSEDLLSRSEKISKDFILPLYLNQSEDVDSDIEFLLMVSTRCLYLKPVNYMISQLGPKPIYPDWLRMDISSGAGRKATQPLIKAVRGRKNKLKRGIVLDATAGWGEDSWIMASFGFSLISLERREIIYLLLRDAHARAGMSFPSISSRIRLLNMDALDFVQSLSLGMEQKDIQRLLPRPDVVYLDPMFPGNDKRKTAEKKATKALRILEGESQINKAKEEKLLDLSLRTAQNKVVIKRPTNGILYAGGTVTPVHQVYGKGIRYDVYMSD